MRQNLTILRIIYRIRKYPSPHLFLVLLGNGHPSEYHSFLWENGVMTDLGLLDSGYSYANAINDFGYIVGYSGTGWPNYQAVVWDNEGDIFDLNELLLQNSGWHLIYASDINNSGQTIG